MKKNVNDAMISTQNSHEESLNAFPPEKPESHASCKHTKRKSYPKIHANNNNNNNWKNINS